MKKLYFLFFLLFAMPAFSAGLPSNVITVTPAEIIKKIESSQQPFVLLIFTSWCPYCKKQVDALSQLTPAEQLRIPEIYAVSVDNNPEDYSRYISTKKALYFPLRLYVGDSGMKDLLRGYGSSYDGGIPYLAVFKNRKLLKEFNGYTEPLTLKAAP